MEENRDKIRMYALAGAVVLFILTGYFQYFHKKKSNISIEPGGSDNAEVFNIPQIKTFDLLENHNGFVPVVSKSFRVSIRDIFKPLEKKGSKILKNKVHVRRPDFRLKGSVVGNNNPVAIINDRFLRKGDVIEGYRIVKIGKKSVVLVSGKDRITLEMIKHE